MVITRPENLNGFDEREKLERLISYMYRLSEELSAETGNINEKLAKLEESAAKLEKRVSTLEE